MSVSSGQKIAKNTFLLYLRMAIVMIVNLYTVRLVLKALGTEDYGIYDVVAGIVSLFISVSSVLSVATQRFYSYSLGKKNQEIKYVYSSSIVVYFVLAIFIVVICESVGLWFLNTHLSIPDYRMPAANWVYHFSILSFVFLILQTPFSSAVMANEDMGIFAIISLSECFLKLFIAYFISKTEFDRLIIYGFLLMLVPCLSLISYFFIVKNKYKECKFSFKWVKKWREILNFSLWTFCGSLAGVGMAQVCTIIVNIFFGPIVNAARAIATQMSNAINAFSQGFLMAVRPPIIKSYAEGNYDTLNKLFIYSNKFTYYLLIILFLPLFSEMRYVLHLWLGVEDIQTVLFSRLMLIYAFILALNNPITFVMQATGKVKQYHTLVEIPTLLVAPITYLLYAIGFPPQATYITMIVAILISHIIRIVCIRRYYEHFELDVYLISFLLRALIVTIILVLMYLLIMNLLSLTGVYRLLLSFIVSVSLACPIIFLIGMSVEERGRILDMAKSLIIKQNK